MCTTQAPMPWVFDPISHIPWYMQPAMTLRSDELAACSLGLSATSQQYFSLRTNQPAATSRNQPAVLFSQSKPAPAISHQPTEQALGRSIERQKYNPIQASWQSNNAK
jgi:hypothetical protein